MLASNVRYGVARKDKKGEKDAHVQPHGPASKHVNKLLANDECED